jgi:hypothetical protein
MRRIARTVALAAAATVSTWCGDALDAPAVEVALTVSPQATNPPSGFWMVVESVTLLPCDDTAAWLRWSPAPAAAHGEAAPNVIAAPSVIDLTRASTTLLGVMRPLPDCYDRLGLVIGPADDDAAGLPGTPMLGASIGVTQGETTSTLSLRREVTLALPAPLRLDEGEDAALVVNLDAVPTAAGAAPAEALEGWLLAVPEHLAVEVTARGE